MKRFIIRLLLFCLAPLPVLFLFNHIVDKGLQKSGYYYYAEWNDLFNGKINADLLILGSSRAWVQISPRILDSELHLNSYNLGMDGTCFELNFERLKLYLAHNKKPKYILQEVGFNTTLVRFPTLPGTQQFLPYLNDPAVWDIITSHTTTLNFLDRYFPMYKYNNEFVVVKEGINSYFGRGVRSAKYKGYQGQDKVWDSSFYNFKINNPEGIIGGIDSQGIAIFKQFLDFCKTNDIKVILVYPPVYYEGLTYIRNHDKFVAIYNNFSAEYNVPFLNYMNDSLNYNRYNFYNSQHLNKHASEIFTTELGVKLQEYIK